MLEETRTWLIFKYLFLDRVEGCFSFYKGSRLQFWLITLSAVLSRVLDVGVGYCQNLMDGLICLNKNMSGVGSIIGEFRNPKQNLRVCFVNL